MTQVPHSYPKSRNKKNLSENLIPVDIKTPKKPKGRPRTPKVAMVVPRGGGGKTRLRAHKSCLTLCP